MNDTYVPDFSAFQDLSCKGDLIPIYREIDADLETPVSAYLKVAQGNGSFLLESVEGGERVARYSFIGTDPYKHIITGPGQPDGDIDPLVKVRQEIEQNSLRLCRYRRCETVCFSPRLRRGLIYYLYLPWHLSNTYRRHRTERAKKNWAFLNS